MSSNIVETEITIELKVTIRAELTAENDGIGGYEYCGFKGYDRGQDYFIVEDISWRKGDFTPAINEQIDKYIESNREELDDKIIEIHESNIKDNF